MFSLKNLDKRLYDSHGRKKRKKKLVYIDVRTNSIYKDMILIQGTPLESPPIPLSGNVVFSVSDNVKVKRIKLRLVCHYKLDFVQLVHDDMASIVKERTKILECTWANLLKNSEGETQFDFTKVHKSTKKKTGLLRGIKIWNTGDGDYSSGHHGSSASESVASSHSTGHTSSEHGKWYQAGNYEVPFQVQLPNDIPETIEGLQSGSILYNFILEIETEERNNKVDVTNKYNFYKYLRILRTLSMNHIAIQEEMMVSNTIRNMLQYQISIPSRAVSIGDESMIGLSIKLIPFEKSYYQLDKIMVGLVQEYCVKDRHDEEYVDSSTINPITIASFRDIEGIVPDTNELIDSTELKIQYEMPKNLKSITQDCDIMIGDERLGIKKQVMYVRHELSVRIKFIKLKDDNKPLEIKLRLPVLLYVSPMKKLLGRRVYFNESTGRIHFRANDYVPLFTPNTGNSTSLNQIGLNSAAGDSQGQSDVRDGSQEVPPPLYSEIDQDIVYTGDNVESQLFVESTRRDGRNRDSDEIQMETNPGSQLRHYSSNDSNGYMRNQNQPVVATQPPVDTSTPTYEEAQSATVEQRPAPTYE